MPFLIIGDANADVVAPVARFPSESDDVRIKRLEWVSGGSAANVATGLALLGASVSLLARVGRDPAAEVALRAARAAGANLELVQHGTTATGICYAVISPNGERTFFSFRGANVELDMPQHAAFDDMEWLHVAGHALLEGAQQETTLALIEHANQHNIPISLDLCLPLVREQPHMLRELHPKLNILFGNAQETHECLIPEFTPRTLVVVKRGALGCELRGEAAQSVPGFPTQAIDTNGCGDAFVAAFLWAHTQGMPASQCAQIANAAGALAATRYGAAESLPPLAELEAFLADNDRKTKN